MTGHVDDRRRALIRVPLRTSRDGPLHEIAAWVDTAFDGGLTIPQGMVAALGLTKRSTLEAMMADGRTVELETFDCYLDWFGATYRVQAIASDGAYPLLGTELLAQRRLIVDYTAKTVDLV